MQKLVKGLRRDELPVDQPEGSWRDAQNIVAYKAFKAISNEDGADNVTPTASFGYQNFPSTKKVIGSLALNTEKLFFFGTTNPIDSEIGIVTEDNKYRTILKDDTGKIVLNFNENYPIQATFEKKFNDNLVIAWVDHDGVSSLNPPKVLNTDCIPFNILADFTVDPLDLGKAQTLLQLFSPYNTPIINEDNLEIRDGGGILKTGAYYPFFSYELADGSTTSYSKIYNGVPIYKDNQSLAFASVGGDLGGVSSSKYIWFKADNVDTNYRFINIGYIYSNNNVLKAYYVKKYTIVTSSLEISLFGNEQTISEVDISSVLVPNSTFIGAKTITNLQKKLYLGNVEKEPDIEYQTYANLIKIKWVKEKDISVHGIVKSTKVGGLVTNYGSYKDGGLVFFDKSWKSGEVLAPFIVFKLKSGGYSRAFHIPGRDVIAGDKTVLNPTTTPSDLNDLDGGNPIYKYQIHDTSTVLGDMGYWENENEQYPLDVTGLAVHPDYANIPGVTTTNRKVRHHVFPDLRALKGYGKAFLNGVSTGKSMTFRNGSLGNPANEDYYSYYDSPGISVGTGFVVNNVGNGIDITGFPTAGVFTISNEWYNDFSANDTGTSFGTILYPLGNNGHYWLTWTIYKNGAIIVQYSADIGGNSPFPIFASSFPDGGNNFYGLNLSVLPGDVITIEYHIETPYSLNKINSSNPTDVGNTNATFGSILYLDFKTGQTGAQPLGIEVSNVNIPANLVPLIDSWEIFYAKRTESNIRVVAQDMIKASRFHNFDLLSNKIVNNASYLKPLLDYNVSGGVELLDSITTGPTETQFPTQKIEYISNFIYLGENVSLPINNTGKSESVYIVGGHAQTSASYLETTYGKTNTLLDICVYKRDIYFPLQIQELISTGKNIKVLVAGTQPITKMYGGDVYIVGNGFRDDTGTNIAYYLACESVSNVPLRYEDLVATKFYYPKNTNPTPSWYGYNKDYNCINDFNKVDIYFASVNCSDISVTKLHHRIPYSITDGTESKLMNWRVFKTNDYYEMPKDKGVIWNILGGNKVLYIHHEYALFIAEIKDRMATGSSGDVFLSSSDVFDRPPQEVQPTSEGFAGTQSQFAIILCKFGYFFVDRQSGKLFQYIVGQQLKEISNQGLYHFFGTYSQTNIKTIDNPFIGRGYTIGFDQKNNRIIFVKNEISDDTGYSFTISYSPEINEGQGGWLSFHSYLPNVLLNNRSGMYGIDNTQHKLIKYNSLTKKGIFFDAEVINESYIDVVVNDNPEDTKRFDNVNWISVTEKNNINSETESITGLVVYNDTQCSGKINLQAEGGVWYGKDARNTEETWNFNNFNDNIKNNGVAFLDNKNQIVVSNINTNKSWYDKSKFISKYVIFRLITDNVNQKNLHISAVGSNLKKSDR